MKLKEISAVIFFSLTALLSSDSWCATRGTPHDLSAETSSDMCRFCHTPHGSLAKTPGWSQKLSTSVYKIYQSSSLEAKVGQPTGPSKLCLSCHDGTVALTSNQKGGKRDVFITPGDLNIGTDLSDDHPISFVYSEELTTKDLQIRPLSTVPEQLKLDRSRELQCTTCHNPHENQYGDFLVLSNERSGLCLGCHNLYDWTNSSHESSEAATLTAKDLYLKKSKYSTVAENGCLSCHRPHSAGGNERLLHFKNSEDNCLNCHDGSVAQTNLRKEMSKLSTHNVIKYKDIHDIREVPLTTPKHVECSDCHNPHSTTDQDAQSSSLSGSIRNTVGVSLSGSTTQRIQFEYELCFKCHADNPDRFEPTLTREITQSNTRLEFDATNPSYHPVVATGVNDDVPSLLSPLTENSIISCTDCHSSDNPNIKGPHGSNYPYLLAYNYETRDNTTEDSFAYELCYKCHSRNSILNNESFSKHAEHLGEQTPCSACHDPHGISSAQGTTSNNSHLINFDTNIVRSNSNGDLFFEESGSLSGSCSLLCHETDHVNKTY